MKTISELQKSVEELTQSLKNLSADLCEIENAKNQTDNILDYDEISMQAKTRLYENHPLADCDEKVKEHYLRLLFSLLYYETKAPKGGLIYIYRIAYSGKYTGDLKQLYAKSVDIPVKELDEIVTSLREQVLPNGVLSEMLAVEMLILTRTYVKDKEEPSKYLARLFTLLNLKEEQVNFALELAKVITTEKPEEYKSERPFLDEQFTCYINDSTVLRKHITNSRKVHYMKQGKKVITDKRTEYVGCKLEEKTVYVVYKIASYSAYTGYNGHNGGPHLVTFGINLYGIGGTIFENVPNSHITGDDSYTARIGYYHSQLDIKSLSENWYNAQPNSDPQYAMFSHSKIESIADNANWEKYEKVERISNSDSINALSSSMGLEKIIDFVLKNLK